LRKFSSAGFKIRIHKMNFQLPDTAEDVFGLARDLEARVATMDVLELPGLLALLEFLHSTAKHLGHTYFDLTGSPAAKAMRRAAKPYGGQQEDSPPPSGSFWFGIERLAKHQEGRRNCWLMAAAGLVPIIEHVRKTAIARGAELEEWA
jgi:hypothetical protein